MNTVKTELTTIVENLPDNCSYEDLQYQLYVIEKVRQSKAAASKEILSHKEVELRLKKWL